MRYKSIKNTHKVIDDLAEFMRGYPKVEYRYFV